MAAPLIKVDSKKLTYLASSQHFERKLSRRFSINDELLSSQADQQCQSLLLQLPYDVQMLLYESIGHAPSQVALALTCKQMALVASDVNLSRTYVSAKYAGLLPKEVFDVPALMKQLSSWIPNHLRLCDHCLTCRPHDTEYWRTIEGCEVSNFWSTKTGWIFADASWHKQIHNICPSCHITCSLSDYVDCDGCRALGRLGDIDWARVALSHRGRTEEEIRAGRYAT